jgi:hypothetical protein
MLRKKTAAPMLDLPVSEALNDENVAAVRSFRPWIVAAAILLIVAYTMPFLDIARERYEGAPPYSPDSPIAQHR